MIRTLRERKNPWKVIQITQEVQIPQIIGDMLAQSLYMFRNLRDNELHTEILKKSLNL